MKTNLSSCCNAEVSEGVECLFCNHCKRACALASPEVIEQEDSLKVKILNILATQASITAQGWDYTGEKDWALNRILDLFSTQEKELKLNIGLLRQWLNERVFDSSVKCGGLVTNEDLEAFLINKNNK